MYIYVQVPFKSSPTFPRLKVGEIVRLLSPYGTRHGAIPCTEESFETSDTRYGDRDARRRLVARRFSLPMHARFLVYFISTDYRHTACIIARVRVRLKSNTSEPTSTRSLRRNENRPTPPNSTSPSYATFATGNRVQMFGRVLKNDRTVVLFSPWRFASKRKTKRRRTRRSSI